MSLILLKSSVKSELIHDAYLSREQVTEPSEPTLTLCAPRAPENDTVPSSGPLSDQSLHFFLF